MGEYGNINNIYIYDYFLQFDINQYPIECV